MTILSFDLGTGYDLFVSLWVLHHPANFGLRPSWAAGVRSRLAPDQRSFLERTQSFLPVPLAWLFSLPAGQKSASGVLSALKDLAPAERLMALSLSAETPPDVTARLKEISQRKTWGEDDLDLVRQSFHFGGQLMTSEAAVALCGAWCEAEIFGESYLCALQAFYQSFFAEEEPRIGPALDVGLGLAEEQAKTLTLGALLEEISHGVSFEPYLEIPEFVLAPSFWVSPLVIYGKVAPQTMLLVFGCRPEKETLVPGERLPENLVPVLKSLADSTRLHILCYLAEKPHTPSQLARRLRLRPPTVIHHLNDLRLAGLVQVILQPEGERRYTLRREAILAAMDRLKELLK